MSKLISTLTATGTSSAIFTYSGGKGTLVVGDSDLTNDGFGVGGAGVLSLMVNPDPQVRPDDWRADPDGTTFNAADMKNFTAELAGGLSYRLDLVGGSGDVDLPIYFNDNKY